MKQKIFGAALAALLAMSGAQNVKAEETSTQTTPAQAAQGDQDRATLAEARIAALKAGLKLTDAQQKDWDALENVLHQVIAERNARKAAFVEAAVGFRDHDDVIGAMKLNAQDLAARGAELQKVADAAAPLFASLSAEQKHSFALLLRSFAPHP